MPLPSAKWLPTPIGKGFALRADLGPLIAIAVVQKSSLGRRRCFKDRSCRVGPAARRHPERQDLNFQASNHFSRTWYDSGLPQKQPCSSGS